MIQSFTQQPTLFPLFTRTSLINSLTFLCMLSSDKKQNAEWSPIKTSLLLQITIFHCPSSHQQLMLQACDLTFVISETKRAVWINVYKPSKRGCSEVRWAVCFHFLCVVFFKKNSYFFSVVLESTCIVSCNPCFYPVCTYPVSQVSR